MTVQPPPPIKIKKPLWRRLLKWTLRSAVALIVLAVAAYAVTNYWAAKTIHNEIARIRAAGEPLTFADLDALTPKVDRAHDAGPFYAAAAELLNSDFESDNPDLYDALFHSDLQKISPQTLAWAHRSLDQNRLPLQLLDQGSALPGCNSDIQLQYGISFTLPNLAKARRLINLASLRTRTLAFDDHSDQAIVSLTPSLGLLRTMDRQPVILDALVQLALLARTDSDAQFILQTTTPSEPALQKLQQALQQIHLVQPRQVFLAERVYMLEVSRNLIANPRPAELADAPPLPERDSWTRLGITGRIMTAKTLPIFAQYLDVVTGDLPATLKNAQTISDASSSAWLAETQSSVLYLVTYCRSLSIHRSTLIALQIERYRLAHENHFPDSLAQLPNSADLPKDPFTGKDLLYLKTPDGYCIYSAGRGRPEGKLDPAKDPVAWSERWGAHIRTQHPQQGPHVVSPSGGPPIPTQN